MSLTVAICGSMTFIGEMNQLGSALKDRGFLVHLPALEESGVRWNSESLESLAFKRRYIDGHLEKIRSSDLVLIANYPKEGLLGYIGANTLMEAAFGYALGKRIILLYEPGQQPCRIEIASIANTILDGDIDRISALSRA
jgi:hypothetical protein